MRLSASDKAAIHDRVRELDYVLDRDLARKADRARRIVGDHAWELTRALDCACDLTRALDRARSLDRARELIRDLELVLVLDRDVARAIGGTLVRDLDRDYAHARELTRDLDRVLDGARAVSNGERRAETERFAGRLVAAATRTLPIMDQARYGEEFRSELAEIARAGGGRWPQMVYAVRLLLFSWSLRGELRDPQRRRALP